MRNLVPICLVLLALSWTLAACTGTPGAGSLKENANSSVDSSEIETGAWKKECSVVVGIQEEMPESALSENEKAAIEKMFRLRGEEIAAMISQGWEVTAIEETVVIDSVVRKEGKAYVHLSEGIRVEYRYPDQETTNRMGCSLFHMLVLPEDGSTVEADYHGEDALGFEQYDPASKELLIRQQYEVWIKEHPVDEEAVEKTKETIRSRISSELALRDWSLWGYEYTAETLPELLRHLEISFDPEESGDMIVKALSVRYDRMPLEQYQNAFAIRYELYDTDPVTKEQRDILGGQPWYLICFAFEEGEPLLLWWNEPAGANAFQDPKSATIALDFEQVVSAGTLLEESELTDIVSFLTHGKDEGEAAPWGFLRQTYSDPSEVDVSLLFYDKGTEKDLTPEEEAAAWAAAGYEPIGFEVQKRKLDSVKALFAKYTGKELTEDQVKSFEVWIYVPEYDAYYSFVTDMPDDVHADKLGRGCKLSATEARALGIRADSEEIIAVEWLEDTSAPGRDSSDAPLSGMVILIPDGDTFRIAANLLFKQ